MAYEDSTFLPGETAAVAAQMVSQEFTLAALINHDAGNMILEGGRKGRKIEVKQPVALVAHARGIDDVTNKIILDTLAEKYVDLTLGVHAYSALALGEGDLNLDIENFSAQVLKPQAEAVANYVNTAVLDAFLAESYATIPGLTFDPEAPTRFFTGLRKALRDKGIPSTGLRVLAGTAVYAALLDSKAFEDVSQSGSTAALREAQVGRVRGFDVVESVEIPEGDVVAFHRDAYTLGMRAPLKPNGAAWGETVVEAGVPLRHLMDYDLDYTADRSMFSTFVGVAKMPLFKVERTQDTKGKVQGDSGFVAGNATVSEVAGGAVMRIDTDAITATV